MIFRFRNDINESHINLGFRMRQIAGHLARANRFLSWVMLILFYITILSGYSMTAKGDLVMKLTLGLINKRNGYYLHRKASYLLTLLTSFHISVNLRLELLRKGARDSVFLNMLIFAVFFAMIAVFTIIEFL